MMKFLSHFRRQTCYASLSWHESKVLPGVQYATRGVSLSQRIELTKKARELSIDHEFLRAGDAVDHLAGSLGDLLVRKLYLEWGLAEVTGLTIDGQTATAELLVDKGPEALSNEILSDIRGELGLSEDERKN